MRIQITPPDSIHATILLPSSKSISNRALIINALGNGLYPIENLSDCDDTQVMIRALNGQPNDTIDIQAAGTAMRFLTAYLSVTPGERMITGTQRMQQRPIQVLVDALRELGADIEYVSHEGYPPLRIRGKALTRSAISLPGNVSSQYISALLMIGPTLPQGLKLTLTGDIISRPYINLTLQLMADFGAKARWETDHVLVVEPQPYQSVPYAIESDWSAASYWYQMASLSKEATITLPGLFEKSYQGDSKVAELFASLGVKTIHEGPNVILRKEGKPIKRMEYNFINQPDLAQTFVVTCALLNIPFRFSGLQTLKIKETDRIAALIREMGKLGYVLQESEGSVLSWEEKRCPRSIESIDTYEDHRMAMAFAPASLVLPDITINNPQVVSKSYPRYWDDLHQAGFIIKEI
ncbi:MAG: 3-phosphoshikimate 1-carboxyvinyltransferase [Bacteroides sp.]|nr:3-phosphoshikimate 1-carboxyvinyltransferase [Bacteroides sp.]